MTNQEAIEILKKDGWGYPENMHTEAVMMAIDALDKQTPKIPKHRDMGNTSLFGEAICPICGNLIFGTEKFCSECGQMIDWSEVDK